MPNPIARYLERHSEADCKLTGFEKSYHHVIVIPAFRETTNDVLQVTADLCDPSNLLVIVVNNSSQANDPSAISLQSELTGSHATTQLSDNTTLVHAGMPDFLLVDRFSDNLTINPRLGVGLARKIGCDIALTLKQQRLLRSDWIHTTDADARLPADYFNQFIPLENRQPAAVISPFRHQPDPDLELPSLLYEIKLLYHTAGIGWAGSPYAFPTIGSTMTINANSYAAVRGFPRRNTGEDFYLLNKLRKIGSIEIVTGDPIILAGRRSDRVPIGTGTALSAISQLTAPESSYQYEHPGCYQDLKTFLEVLSQLATEQPAAYQFKDRVLHDYGESSGLYAHFENKRGQSPTASVMQKHLSDWFDGLKTRQLIHHLRDHRYGTVAAHALTSADFVTSAQSNLTAIRDALFSAIYHNKIR